jgi:hypothetical protein
MCAEPLPEPPVANVPQVTRRAGRIDRGNGSATTPDQRVDEPDATLQAGDSAHARAERPAPAGAP